MVGQVVLLNTYPKPKNLSLPVGIRIDTEPDSDALSNTEHRTLSLSKLADTSSPVLMQHCSMGKTIPRAKLEFMRADGDGKPVKYYQVELEKVLPSSMDQIMHGGGLLQDQIGLRFSKVKWAYT